MMTDKWTCELCGQRGHNATAHQPRAKGNSLKTVGIVALTLAGIWVAGLLLQHWDVVAAIWNA